MYCLRLSCTIYKLTVFIEIHVIYLKVLQTNLLAKAEILFTRSHLIIQPELGYLLQSSRSPSLYLYFLTPLAFKTGLRSAL